MSLTILITGAAGKTGRAVLRALEGKAKRVRALIHRSEHEGIVRESGASDVIQGDLLDRNDMDQATVGIDAIYHICPNMHRAEVEIGQILLGAAGAAGVTRFVYHSVLHPQAQAMPHHGRKLRVEEMLFETDLAYTILQPAVYMQNVLAFEKQILDSGVLPVPYPTATRLAVVDLEDVAEAAAKVLTEAGHEGATYELCGQPGLSQRHMAETLAGVLGRPVRAKEESTAEWSSSDRARALDTGVRDDLVAMFDYYRSYGMAGNPNSLNRLLGRKPTTVREFAQRVFRNAGMNPGGSQATR